MVCVFIQRVNDLMINFAKLLRAIANNKSHTLKSSAHIY